MLVCATLIKVGVLLPPECKDTDVHYYGGQVDIQVWEKERITILVDVKNGEFEHIDVIIVGRISGIYSILRYIDNIIFQEPEQVIDFSTTICYLSFIIYSSSIIVFL